jgi:periplasmic protein CpxP/Spy
MKKLILGLCTMFALTTFAQNAPAATEAPAKGKGQGKEMKNKGKEHGKEMSEQGKAKGEEGKGQLGSSLGLSADQQTQFNATNKAHQEAVKKVQGDPNMTVEAKKAEINALKSKYDANVKGILNAEQYTKWAEKREAKKAGGDKKGGDKKMDDHKGGSPKVGDKPKGKSDKEKPQNAAKSN